MEERERGETIEDFSKRLDERFRDVSEVASSFVSGYVAATVYFMASGGLDEVPGELEKNLDFSLMLYVLGSSGMGDHVAGALGRVGAR